MPWTYMLRCADGSYYVGSTWDLERRVNQHQGGEGAAYTRRRRPVELVWCAEFQRIAEAFEWEKRIQGWSRAKREALIKGDEAVIRQLASRAWAAQQVRKAVPTTPAPPPVS
ncbi:GIY-YIG nuclease family protein [Nocardioides piscis]|uniref:GIY-YIG nuclease family protein n=1 Tax=Nocardioides piscis TaxID=2714938 RepID=A0A6G7YL38_9ACTN|nr:GIY-YIG nuclease family protein [Nocardioides piscis]QIK77455.1 GIY-YIG nuclease family protein [Nocardioides piscis]